MHFTRRQIIIMFAGGILIAGLIAGFWYVTRKPVAGPTVSVTMWGVDDKTAMTDLIAAYSAYRPGITITYTQLDPSEYETKLLKALAAGTGPDIFEITNRSLPRWQSALAPLPTSSTQFSAALMDQAFPTVVRSDFTDAQGRVYGVPLSIDTLAMFYNKDYFDAAGIALPPATWDDFDADIAKLRQLDAQGNLVRAAAAIGGTRASIPNADDIVYLLMLQNGTQMVSSDHTYSTFPTSNNGKSAQAAVNFYLQFSNPASPYYTWSDAFASGTDAGTAFAQGKVAIVFDYHATLAQLKQKAPFLNIGVARMPQPSGGTVAVNYPKYYGLVAAKTGNAAYAWDFILYSTIYAAGENLYLADTGAPAAQRTAIAAQENPDPATIKDITLSIFAEQALSARSWYEADDTQIDPIFDQMLSTITSGSLAVPIAIQRAGDAITQVMRSR